MPVISPLPLHRTLENKIRYTVNRYDHANTNMERGAAAYDLYRQYHTLYHRDKNRNAGAQFLYKLWYANALKNNNPSAHYTAYMITRKHLSYDPHSDFKELESVLADCDYELTAANAVDSLYLAGCENTHGRSNWHLSQYVEMSHTNKIHYNPHKHLYPLVKQKLESNGYTISPSLEMTFKLRAMAQGENDSCYCFASAIEHSENPAVQEHIHALDTVGLGPEARTQALLCSIAALDKHKKAANACLQWLSPEHPQHTNILSLFHSALLDIDEEHLSSRRQLDKTLKIYTVQTATERFKKAEASITDNTAEPLNIDVVKTLHNNLTTLLHRACQPESLQYCTDLSKHRKQVAA